MSTPLNGSIVKAFDILRLASRERPDITAAIVQAELAMNAATAHRFLATLEEVGALVAVRRGVYRLSLWTAELGRIADATNPYATLVQPQIKQLRERLGESVMACRPSREGPLCVSVALADRPITVSIRVGTRLDNRRSAQGKLWLADQKSSDLDALSPTLRAELDVIRRQGFARNLGETEPDIAAIAAPVRGARGELVLTISVFGLLNRFTDEFQVMIQKEVRRTAMAIEGLLIPPTVTVGQDAPSAL